VVDSAGIGRGSWDAVLDNMHDFGLRVSDGQRANILDYLATYLGPKSPPSAPEIAEAPKGGVDGAQIFADVCAACHQPNGEGKGKDFPPLAGNPDIFLAPDFPVKIVLYGIEGPIETEGRKFENVMPPFDFLSDEEISAVINYIRSQWGNDALAPVDEPALTPNDIAKVRESAMSSEEVRTLRHSLLP
jgi:mono/diheme cytochrome c family protein